jgi:peroxiredoxin
VLIGLMVLALAGLLFVVKDLFEQRIVEAGDSAPAFKVTTDQGRTIAKSDFGGKVLVLNFWATWCPPCVQEMPSLNQFAREMKDQGVVVLGVSVDKSEQTYRRFVQQMQPAFLTARDPEADIPADYGSFKWPETYVIDSEGQVRLKYIGPRNWTDPAIIAEIKNVL